MKPSFVVVDSIPGLVPFQTNGGREGDGFSIVEKHPGERQIAVETDPRG